MADADRMLRQAAEELQSSLARRTIPETPLRTAARVGRFAWAITIAALAIAGLVWLTAPGLLDDPNGELVSPPTTSPVATSAAPPTVPTTAPPDVSVPVSGPLFGEETGVVLLFDDGGSGLTAVDPDRRLASRSAVKGQQAGDEPYSMVRVGDHLVVGWAEPFAVDIVTRESTPLGSALIFLPGVEKDRVWMVNFPWTAPKAWQVSLDGKPLSEPTELSTAGIPAIGIEGGLALQTDTGLTLWNATTGEARLLEGSGNGIVFDSIPGELVWCHHPCTELLITNTTTLETEILPPPSGYHRFVTVGLGFGSPQTSSPDRRFLAALVADEEPREFGEGEALWIYDRSTGQSAILADPDTTVSYVAWSPDGTQVFASNWSYQEKVSVIWRYHLTTESFASVVVPFGGLLSPVVIDSAQASAYFDDVLRSIDRCGVGSRCTFEY